MDKESLLNTLKSFDKKLNSKGDFIIDLGKKNLSAAHLIEGELIEYFVNESSYFWIRHASISVLLKDLRSKDKALLLSVQKVVMAPHSDIELVSNCLSGIGVAYFNEGDKSLIEFLYSYTQNVNMDISHRCYAYAACLNVLGYSTVSVADRCGLSLLSDYDLNWLSTVDSNYKSEIEGSLLS